MHSATYRQKETQSIVMRFARLLLLALFVSQSNATAVAQRKPSPELLTYKELVQLYEQEPPPVGLQNKLQRLLTTPFVSNAATARGVKPILPNVENLGRSVRMVAWNIERGLEFDAIRSVFTDGTAFSRFVDSTAYPIGSEKRKLVLEQVALMKQADVIVLNEVDWGMKRTQYRNVAADLASALGMNYAYGVEFVEIDPIELGLEKFEELKPEERERLLKEMTVDQSRYRGLHGSAILSRFPLKNVRLEPFKHQPHDWYKDELKSIDKLEAGKRKAGQLVFQEKVRREVRRGGRMMLTAEIGDARVPGGGMVIIATHLESKSKPEGRRKQLEELLARIRSRNGPVVIAGDMNTSTKDSTPTSIERELKKRVGSKSFWIKQGIGIITGVRLPLLVAGGINSYRTGADPTAKSIPLVASNPEAEFFERLKDFRFADGNTFDFRGEPLRSFDNKDDPLANSNQRADKGFTTTYEVERTIASVGKFKLDWFFVKPPALTDPYSKSESHRFAPHFGRTLNELNDSVKDRMSDHAPLMLDLPLTEPQLGERN